MQVMKILFTGNSQAGCLGRALASSGRSQYPNLKSADWIVVSGGGGPYLKLDGDRIKVVSFNPQYPPRFNPSASILSRSIHEYDVIIISALGYIDGGFKHKNRISTLTSVVPACLDLREDISGAVPVTRSCFEEIAFNKWYRDPGMIGFRFLRELKRVFSGKIIVQPFPLLSEAILGNDDWYLNKIYKCKESANEFMLKIKDNMLSDSCSGLNCFLLEYPDSRWRETGFTPKEYMLDHDCMHPTRDYGELVLSQIERQLI